MGFNGLKLVLLRLYRVIMGFSGLKWVLLGFTGFYWVLLGFTGFYWVLLGFYWVLLNLTGFFPMMTKIWFLFAGYSTCRTTRRTWRCSVTSRVTPPATTSVATSSKPTKRSGRGQQRITKAKQTKKKTFFFGFFIRVPSQGPVWLPSCNSVIDTINFGQAVKRSAKKTKTSEEKTWWSRHKKIEPNK